MIVDDERPNDGKLLANPEFLRFAAHWGFRIRACRPYRAQTKGKVERPVSYLPSGALYSADGHGCLMRVIGTPGNRGPRAAGPRLDFLNGLGQTMFRLRAYNCTVTDPP